MKINSVAIKIIVFAVIVLSACTVDLVVKEIVSMQLVDDIIVIPGFWSFHLTLNNDMGFSLLRFTDSFLDKDVKKVIIITLQLIGVTIAGFFYFSKGKFLSPWLKRLPLAFICAGGLGNAIDRIIRGYVIDYVLWYYGDFSWPVFNLADVYSVIGVAFLVFFIFFMEKEKKKKIENPPTDATPNQDVKEGESTSNPENTV